ncbi:4-(cytidine 5'-diphospho)-2-C-methyl-D-erythritol kinase [Entomomonas asaccharolytica]|uniref:4-diphosphocytidyl-2-C-methyl-D-erythritol kinase n=1 Tax=Entomomonas asaccharolytica TaxID=2785331 RepID=A0A974NEY9_9GAMM|nr:4-(cytidine 5'-diphospho)-2-C-methyl-D-erythritol kinase [Entomomonas asaccharolytica]QQP85438.1 4-(cytidine 5'-diphospho)-2-C-methyl-D-erythritol kinase [Entomomonas asaccharolytica]
MTNLFPDDASLILPAPAKLNLFLHILGRRADGYHNLQTIFQFLDYSDQLAFNCRKDGEIKLHTIFENVPHNDNLIVKAANLLKNYTSSPLGADIWIDKKLPMGGGIGGGSSNAATTLLALNQLWQLNLDLITLAKLALQLGADVPVFVQGKAAFAEGVGEQLTPITPPELWFLVAIPKVAISTATVFNDPLLPRNTAAITYQQVLATEGQNDCQAIVLNHYPAVQDAFLIMNKLAPTKLTGTGACLFASFTTEQQALAAQRQLIDKIDCFIAQGINFSPLHQKLNLSY